MVPKKRWGPKVHHQPEEAQFLCTNRALQDGGHSHAQRSPKARRLDDKSQPEGRLLHDTSNNRPQDVAAVQVARRNLPVQLPAFLVVINSMGLYQGLQSQL